MYNKRGIIYFINILTSCKDQKFLDEVLKEGANKAEEIAQRKIKNIKKILGF